MLRNIRDQVKRHPGWAAAVFVAGLLGGYGTLRSGATLFASDASSTLKFAAQSVSDLANEPQSTSEQLVRRTEVRHPGFGPRREVFKNSANIDVVTFNSVTDSPGYGDQRNFVLVKDAAMKKAGGFADEVEVKGGHEYLIRVLLANNSDSTSLSARDVKVDATVPVTTGTSQIVQSAVSSSNSNPKRIWDQVRLHADRRFNLAYVPGSARYFANAAHTSGVPLPDSLLTSGGASIGMKEMDGLIRGGWSGVVTFRVRPQFERTADFDLASRVRRLPSGQGRGWESVVSAKSGQTVQGTAEITNTGEAQLDNVVVSIGLANGLGYVPGSTELVNSKTPAGSGISDGLPSRGVNIGSYASGANAFVTFKIRVDTMLPLCGVNSIGITTTVVTDYGSKSSSAVLRVRGRDCN